MSLADILAEGYRHTMRGGLDPAPDHAKAITPAEVTAEISRLSDGPSPITMRSHIARTHVTYLRRVLANFAQQPGLVRPS